MKGLEFLLAAGPSYVMKIQNENYKKFSTNLNEHNLADGFRFYIPDLVDTCDMRMGQHNVS